MNETAGCRCESLIGTGCEPSSAAALAQAKACCSGPAIGTSGIGLVSRVGRFPAGAAATVLRGILITTLWALMPAYSVHATQVHASPEGLYTHQIAHAFFAVSMAILIFWLRHRGLVHERGWRLIQFAAFFFILWNVDAGVVHYLDDRNDLFQIIDEGTWHATISSTHGLDAVTFAYYFAKLDHLLCVPAIVLLYAGLSRLLQQARKAAKLNQPA